MPLNLNGFLADTWWYAMTARLRDEDFSRLVDLRAQQGFNAAQVVVGIPPETVPEDVDAASPVGPAWRRNGEFNPRYLQHARERILAMNRGGLGAIVYGAWGPQINWLGVERMCDWWREVIRATDDLDVFYCLSGESNLQLSLKDMILNQRAAGALMGLERLIERSSFLHRAAKRLPQRPRLMEHRRRAWSRVLESAVKLTDKPFIIHPNPLDDGFSCVNNPHLLAANSAQTGHTYQSRPRLHRLPMTHQAAGDPAGRGFINLEPWYEGIHGLFLGQDQLYAYWVSMLAGAVSYCYGAQGIWNVGDGSFLAHWGGQTFSQALALDTPRLIGKSHALFTAMADAKAEVVLQEQGDTLVSIQRKSDKGSITFVPEVSEAAALPAGRVWLPMRGEFIDSLPAQGQVVIISQPGNN